jgi:hypothetical protein
MRAWVAPLISSSVACGSCMQGLPEYMRESMIHISSDALDHMKASAWYVAGEGGGEGKGKWGG